MFRRCESKCLCLMVYLCTLSLLRVGGSSRECPAFSPEGSWERPQQVQHDTGRWRDVVASVLIIYMKTSTHILTFLMSSLVSLVFSHSRMTHRPPDIHNDVVQPLSPFYWRYGSFPPLRGRIWSLMLCSAWEGCPEKHVDLVITLKLITAFQIF